MSASGLREATPWVHQEAVSELEGKEFRMSLPPKVLPGDLITADFMNQMIDALQAFDDRLTKLEAGGGGAVTITAIVPSGNLRMGDELRVFGHASDCRHRSW